MIQNVAVFEHIRNKNNIFYLVFLGQNRIYTDNVGHNEKLKPT